MENEKRLIDANGRYTLHASDNTGYSLLFRNGIICVENELGHCVCEFYAEDAPTVEAVEVVHGRWLKGEFDGEYICSRCGMEYCEADPTVKPYKYCPACGSENE